MLDNTKIILPQLDFSSYQLLIKSLNYYRNGSVEFSSDGDITNDIYLLISKIEENIEVTNK